MTDETIVWLPSRQQCKDVSSLDARIVQASSRSIVVCTPDYVVATTLGAEGEGWWSPYIKDSARHRQLVKEYTTKDQERLDRIYYGRVETVDKYIQQNCIRQLRDQSQEMLDQLSNLDQERRSKSRCSIM